MIHTDDYRIYFPEKNIYITRNHDWAFAAWEIAKLKRVIKENATLIHVDGHLDNVTDGTKVNGLLDIKNLDDIYRITSDKGMGIDNFIWAGIASDTLQKVLYVSHQDYSSEDINAALKIYLDEEEWKVFNKTIRKKNCSALRFRYIEDFRSFIELGVLHTDFLEKKSVILDLDLDYFNIGKGDHFDYENLMSESQIYRNLKTLKELYKWDLITVALSPYHCGGEEQCKHIYDIFLEVFELNEQDGQEW